MKLTIEQSPENRDVEIIIKCPYIDKEMERLIAQIRLYSFTISGKKEGEESKPRVKRVVCTSPRRAYYWQPLKRH